MAVGLMRIIAGVLLVGLMPFALMAETRTAILFGNNRYEIDGLALRNPANDVRALSRVLTGLGFEVREHLDITRTEMLAVLDGFGAAQQDGGVALVFYAGHGIQTNGENWLIGPDLPDLSLPVVRRHSVSLSEIRERLSQRSETQVVIILDACRNMPFPQEEAVQGLAAPAGPSPGFLIAYATDPGNIAADGTGDNSVFTSALLEHLATPGLDLRLALGRVRQDVLHATGGAQVPWVEESLTRDIVLKPQEPLAQASPVDADDVAAWRVLTKSGDASGFAAYLGRFPQGLFAEIARAELERQAPETGSFEPASLPDGEAPRLAAALSILGYLSDQAEGGEVEIRTALRSYSLARPGLARGLTLSTVVGDAAQRAVQLGAYLAVRIRADMRTLDAITELRRIGSDALAQLEAHPASGPDAAAARAAARRDMAAIEEAYDVVLRRLDQSRGYYGQLLETVARHFPEEAERGLPALARGASAQAGQGRAGFEADARRFADHVGLVSDPTRPGTMAWLADFLP